MISMTTRCELLSLLKFGMGFGRFRKYRLIIFNAPLGHVVHTVEIGVVGRTIGWKRLKGNHGTTKLNFQPRR